jgi:hypothetical protein
VKEKQVGASEVDGGCVYHLIRLLGSFKDVMEALIHAPEHIGGEIFLSALFANTRWNVSQDEQVITATIVVVDVSFFHLAATEGAIRIGGHGFVPLVQRSVHFGGLGIYKATVRKW